MKSTISIITDAEMLSLQGYDSTIEGVELLKPYLIGMPICELRKHYQQEGVLWVRLPYGLKKKLTMV